MAAILKFKRMFRHQKERKPSFRQHHFLNMLPADKIKEIQLFSECDHIEKVLPGLSGKKTLFFHDAKHKYVYRKILNRNPDYFVNYHYGETLPKEQDKGCFTVLGNLNRLSVKQRFFDLVVCPFALNSLDVNADLIKRVCSLLKNGGRIILSLRHPQLEHILYNQNPAETFSSDNTISKYFNILKNNSVYTEDMLEGRVDLSLKPFFTEEGEFDYYSEYKNTPITLLIKAVKWAK